MKWIEWRMVSGFVLVVLALLAAGAVSYNSTQEFAETGRAVAHGQEVMRELESTLSVIKDLRNGELAFLLSGDPALLKPFMAALPQDGRHLERLKKLTAKTPGLQGQIVALQQKIDSRLKEIRQISETLPPGRSGVLDQPLLLQQESARNEEIRAGVASLVSSETERLARLSDVLRVKARVASYSFLAMTVLTFALIGYAFRRFVGDMRNRRRSMELLRHSEERYRLLAENSLDLIALVDPKGNLSYASPSHQPVLGYDPGRLMGQNLAWFIHPEDFARVQLVISELPETGPARAIDIRLRKADDRWLESELLLSAFSISGVPGRRLLLSARDISERKQAQKEREKLIEELQEAFARIKVLSGFIPICSSCKKIRDDQGYWNQLEAYIQSHSEAQFSHGICPDCAMVLYPDYFTKRA